MTVPALSLTSVSVEAPGGMTKWTPPFGCSRENSTITVSGLFSKRTVHEETSLALMTALHCIIIHSFSHVEMITNIVSFRNIVGDSPTKKEGEGGAP